jgi:DNA-3-methyladenine glycosylase
MAKLRDLGKDAKPRQLTGGPGRLCEALGISRDASNGIDVTQKNAPLQIVDDGHRPREIKVTARIGITKAADQPLRFVAVEESTKRRAPL